jgi:hypothetical protein
LARSVAFSVKLLCACTAALRFAALPLCRYGALAQASRRVGTSMPPSVPPRRWPEALLMVPTLRIAPASPLMVNALPP